jgi:hypothetical protein
VGGAVRRDERHPRHRRHRSGHWVPFWQQACNERRPYACATLTLLETRYCDAGSGWAATKWGSSSATIATSRRARDVHPRVRRPIPTGLRQRAHARPRAGPPRSADPQLADYEILLREGKARCHRCPGELYARACSQDGPQGAPR